MRQDGKTTISTRTKTHSEEKLEADIEKCVQRLVEIAMACPEVVFEIGSQPLILGGLPRNYNIDRERR